MLCVGAMCVLCGGVPLRCAVLCGCVVCVVVGFLMLGLSPACVLLIGLSYVVVCLVVCVVCCRFVWVRVCVPCARVSVCVGVWLFDCVFDCWLG